MTLHASRSPWRVVLALVVAPFATGCDAHPQTSVVVDNRYAPSATSPLVVYRAFWQAVSFPSAVPPAASSEPQNTVPASENTAYVVLAPGWDPEGSALPASLIVMQSRAGFEAHLDDTLRIPVDDTTFAGHCAAGSFLSQAQADFITQLVFPDDFASFRYDAASCTVTPRGDAGRD